MNEQPPVISLPSSPTKVTSSMTNLLYSNVGSNKPLINVLPSSKLLSRNLLHHKSLRKRRVSTRLTHSTKVYQGKTGKHKDSNFASDLKGKIHSQTITGCNQPIPNQSLSSQYTQRSPINFMKVRMPFPTHVPQRTRHLQHHQQHPEDDSNLLNPPSSIVPPPVVLVPYPIPLPIILPIPLPLTAFLKAYQTKGYSQRSSNDNDSHEEDQAEKGPKSNENEQPLDLSSEQGSLCETDKIFISNKNFNGEVVMDSEGIKSASSSTPRCTYSNSNNVSEDIERKKTNHHAVIIKDCRDGSLENSRPLRKRKIIAEELT